MSQKSNYFFPEIFITGELPKNWTKATLIADGLCGWANCMMGEKPPKMLGHGMALISATLGTAASPEKLMELAKEFRSEPTNN